MARQKKDQYEIDPEDGLIRGIIGAWSAEDKHERLKRYVFASHGARRRFFEDFGKDTGFVDLYCGPGRARIRDTESRIVDGSAVLAAKKGLECTPFQRFVIGDTEEHLVSACKLRLHAAGAKKVFDFVGTAEENAERAINALDRSSLNLSFVDPFNADIPFSVIETLGRIKRMDQLIHFSVMDYKRNLPRMMEDGRLDQIAPGWRSVASSRMSINRQREVVFSYWRKLIEEKLGYRVNEKIVKVRGPKNADIFWLVFASRDKLPDRLWSEISTISPQGSLL
jgi:three-Cys-motif partner protein